MWGSHMQWTREQELNQNGRVEAWFTQSPLHNAPLNRHSVLDYFRSTTFYDPTCNNEQILMRGLPPSALLDEVGVEYEVDRSSAPDDGTVFAIRRQRRISRTDVVLEAVYIVIAQDLPRDDSVGRTEPLQRGAVFPMPDVHSVLTRNLHAALYHIARMTEAMAKRIQLERSTDTDDVDSISAASLSARAGAGQSLVSAASSVSATALASPAVDLSALPVNHAAADQMLAMMDSFEAQLRGFIDAADGVNLGAEAAATAGTGREGQ